MTTIILNGTRVNAINKTPHALNIYDLVTVPSSETVSDGKGEIPLVEVVRDPSKLEGLPEEQEGTVIVVSDITYQAAKPLGRKDLVKAVRDDAGRIIGCRGLAL